MISKLVINEDITLIEALKKIDEGGYGVIFIVNEFHILKGILTDGDVRKALLRGITLTTPVQEVMNKDFYYWSVDKPKELGKIYLRSLKRKHLPIIDKEKRLVDILLLDEIEFTQFNNSVVIMAGGFGSRLSPLTDNCPKPLLKVGSKPILETIIENFSEHGFRNFYLAVNYKAEMIKEYFGDGSEYGVKIRYIEEEHMLGTAGALSLLPTFPTKPIIVINGDILTKVNFAELLRFHVDQSAIATMCVRNYSIKIPYGVVELDDYSVTDINEKPEKTYFVNAGIYVIDPMALEFIPQNDHFDMTQLFNCLINNNYKTAAFPIREYWIDIGRISDFEKANGDYIKEFKY